MVGGWGSNVCVCACMYVYMYVHICMYVCSVHHFDCTRRYTEVYLDLHDSDRAAKCLPSLPQHVASAPLHSVLKQMETR